MAGSLDTNILLRLILQEVPEQIAAIEKLLSESRTFEIADATIFEMVYVLEKLYGIPRDQVAKNVLTIVRDRRFVCNRKLFELAVSIYVIEPKLSLVDCALTQYAKLNGSLPLFTFDAALIKACPELTKRPL